MAKKPKPKYTLEFLGTGIKYEDIKLVEVPEPVGNHRRLWIEFEGERLRLMVSKDLLGEWTDSVSLIFSRSTELHIPSELNTAIGGIPFTMYNVFRSHPNSKKFYYIDEYRERQLRLMHTENFFPKGFDHTEITGYHITKETQ